jgi:hypothetical protein
MDREVVLTHLRVAQADVSQGRERIAEQRRVIAEMEREGRDTARARAALAKDEKLQAERESHLDLLGQELADMKSGA